MGAAVSSAMFGEKEVCIVMAGLACGGKTTIVYKLKLGRVVATRPTVGFNIETMDYNNVNLLIYDFTDAQLREAGALMWKRHLSHCAQGLVFVVDSNDTERITEARDKLHRMLNEANLRDDVPLLVFANKQDLPNALSAFDITLKLDLHSLHPRLWRIQAACATSGEGLHEGLAWLCNNISHKELSKGFSARSTAACM